MRKLWKVFYNRMTGEVYAAYTLRDTFPGEEQNTREILAAEKGVDPADIVTRIEERGAK